MLFLAEGGEQEHVSLPLDAFPSGFSVFGESMTQCWCNWTAVLDFSTERGRYIVPLVTCCNGFQTQLGLTLQIKNSGWSVGPVKTAILDSVM